MPRSVYGACSPGVRKITCPQQPQSIPPEQNIAPYISQTNTIMVDFKTNMDKKITIERLQTLRQLLTVIAAKAGASA